MKRRLHDFKSYETRRLADRTAVPAWSGCASLTRWQYCTEATLSETRRIDSLKKSQPSIELGKPSVGSKDILQKSVDLQVKTSEDPAAEI